MESNDLIYLIGELYVQRREQQMLVQNMKIQLIDKEHEVSQLKELLEPPTPPRAPRRRKK